MICWIDLETTGLDEHAPASGILELALIVTDDDLNFIASTNIVMKPQPSCHDWVQQLHPRVLEMHTKNGLIKDVLDHGVRLYEARDAILAFLKPILGDKIGKVPLGGSTIAFDRVWLREYLPEVHDCFHYRSIDVTSISLCAERWAKKLRDGRPRQADGEHRAMPDIQHSIAVLRYYKENGLFGVQQADGCKCVNDHALCGFCQNRDLEEARKGLAK